MCFAKINVVNQIITRNNPQFPLLGMLNPTFQNQGTANVYVNGLLLEPGDSYTVNVPMSVCQNNIAIVFEQDNTKTKTLYVGYGSETK
jgi:hypothetical protein